MRLRFRRSGEGWNPVSLRRFVQPAWMPAFAGMTDTASMGKARVCLFAITMAVATVTSSFAQSQVTRDPPQAPVPDPAGHPPGMQCPSGTTWLGGACVPIHPLQPAAPSKESAQSPPARNPKLEQILAAQRGETPEVQALVQGTDPNARDKVHQRTALTWTIFLNDQAAFDRFIATGADVNAKDDEGSTPLLAAAQFAMKHDTTAMAEALVAKGADVALRTQGLTPLMHAANSNAPGVAQAILSKLPAGEVDARNSNGMTALSIGASVGASEVVRLLLEKGAKVDGRDEAGKTPLMHAAGHAFPGTVTTVIVLLEKGADAKARDKAGNTPLSEAKQHGPPEAVEILQQAEKASAH